MQLKTKNIRKIQVVADGVFGIVNVVLRISSKTTLYGTIEQRHKLRCFPYGFRIYTRKERLITTYSDLFSAR